MVLGARLGVYGGGRWRKITGVEPSYFVNFGKSLLFYVMGVVSLPTKRHLYRFIEVEEVPTYIFSTTTPNYTPVTLLPGATIESDFKLELKLMFRFAGESTNLANEGFGHYDRVPSYYSVEFGRHFAASFRYEIAIRILHKYFSFSQANLITQFPTLAPVSVLL